MGQSDTLMNPDEHLDTTMGVLVSMGLEHGWFKWAIISTQRFAHPDTDIVREVIGPFDRKEDAQTWMDNHALHNGEEREIVYIVSPS